MLFFPVRGNLTAVRYRDEILIPEVLPYIRRARRRHAANRQHIEFQQDNAPPHKGRVVTQWFQRNNIPVMPWPARSPDLSPIENAWDLLGRRVAARVTPQSTVADLEQFLIQEWNAIPDNYIRTLMNSMRRRIESCIAVNGGSTKY